MLRLGRAVLSAFMLLMAALSPALADHMTGTYVGIGNDQGTTIVIVQTGGNVEGEILGNDQGSLTGQQDGQNSYSGLISLANGVQYQYQAQWTPQRLDITISDGVSTELHSYVPGAVPAERAPATETQYYVSDNGEQFGPLTLQQVLDRIAAGTSNRQTQVWTADRNAWVAIDTVAELAQALDPDVPNVEPPAVDTQYYVFDNNEKFGPLSQQQVLDRIAAGTSNRQTQVWTAELGGWVLIDTVAELAGALPAEQVANYYLYEDGVQTGPWTLESMLAGIANGGVAREELVWQPGWPEWVRADEVAEFVDAFPPLIPDNVVYFVVVDGARAGPMTADEVIARITSLSSTGEDLAWKKGLEAWAPLSTFTEFEEAFAAVAPPPEPPVVDPPVVEPIIEEPPALPDDVVDPETPPDVPAEPETPVEPETPEVSDEAFLAAIETMVTDYAGEDVTAAKKAEAVACVAALLAPLTTEEKQMLLDAAMQPSGEQLAALDASYPGLSAQVDACGNAAREEAEPVVEESPPVVEEPPPVVEEPPPVVEEPPAVEDPPAVEETTEGAEVETPATEEPVVEEDAFTAALRVQIESFGLPVDLGTAMFECAADALSVLTDEEKQVMMDANMQPTDEQKTAFEAAHPGLKVKMNACAPTPPA